MTVLSTAISTILGTKTGTVVGASEATAAFHAATYDTTTFEAADVLVGTGGLTTTSSEMLLPDHEGVYKTIAANTSPYHGWRVVTQYAIYTDTFDVARWVRGGTAVLAGGKTDPDGGSTAYEMDCTGGNGYIQVLNAVPLAVCAGKPCNFSLWVRRVSGSGTFSLRCGNVDVQVDAALTSSWQRISASATNSAGNWAFVIWHNDTTDAVYEIWHPQAEVFEDINDPPSEYVENTGGIFTTEQAFYANTNGNSVASNVVTEATGTLLSTVPSYYSSPALTNAQIQSNDQTNAEWTAVNVTVAQDEAGLTGAPNTACTLTSTAANGTVIANAITAASDDQTTRWFIKRKTGTGTIEITVDNGTTWQDVTTEVDATTSFNECLESLAATANPQIGIRIVTSGDAVIVGNAEAHTAKTVLEVEGSAPIVTAASSVTTSLVELDFDPANHDNAKGAYYAEYQPIAETGGRWLETAAASGGTVFGSQSTDRLRVRANVLIDSAASAITVGAFNKIANAYDSTSGDIGANVEGVWTENTGYTGFSGSLLQIRPSAAANRPQLFRNLKRYEASSYDANKAAIDEDMA